MFDKYAEKYIDSLIRKENFDADKMQKNLFSRKDYYLLLKDVLEIYKNNHDYSILEIRELLFQKSGINEIIKNFIYKRKAAPGIVLSYGTNSFKETIVAGYQKEISLNKHGHVMEDKELMSDDTIFDLASITKLFTSISILKLVEFGLIKIDDSITKYVPEFKNLKNVSIYDLLTFGKTLKTPKRIDEASSFEEAEALLFNIEVLKNEVIYSDMCAMVLKYVIERVSEMSYKDFLDCYFINEYHLNNTHIIVPQNKLYKLASTGLNMELSKKGITYINKRNKEGLPYDPKAIIMDYEHGNLAGHAGLFSNAKDLTSFAKNIINNEVIYKYHLNDLAKNKTGAKTTCSNGYTQYFGYQVYSKNPCLPESEVFYGLSGHAFASSGWTGTHLTIDPENELYCFLGANRSHNRITKVNRDAIRKIIKNEDNQDVYRKRNGQEIICSTKFAYDKDIIAHTAIKLSMQYKMLDDIIEYFDHEEVKGQEIIRNI